MLKYGFYVVFFLLVYVTFAQDKTNSQLFDHASAADSTLNEDIDLLIEYLIKPTQTKKEQAEVVAYWMALNIIYDWKDYASRTIARGDWASTLSNKKGVCQDYAELFKEFCDRLEIECHVVSGYAKGFGYQQGNFTGANHAWNVINISNQYHLIDITWTRGWMILPDQDDTLQIFKSEYLFTDPIEFIKDHYPVNSRWQLLEYPADPTNTNLAHYKSALAYHLAFEDYEDGNTEKAIKLYREAKSLYMKTIPIDLGRATYCQKQIDFLTKSALKK